MKAAVYCLDKMGAPRGCRASAGELHETARGEPLLTLMLGVLPISRRAPWKKPRKTFRAAISASPRDWRANRNLGMVYRKIGKRHVRREVPCPGRRVPCRGGGGRPETGLSGRAPANCRILDCEAANYGYTVQCQQEKGDQRNATESTRALQGVRRTASCPAKGDTSFPRSSMKTPPTRVTRSSPTAV